MAPPDSRRNFEVARRHIEGAIQRGKWRKADREAMGPTFHTLSTEEKLELMRILSRALDSKQIKVEAGALVF